MSSPGPNLAAAGTPQSSSDTASKKRAAESDATGSSTIPKRAATSARGQLMMRRSGTPASFHGPMRPGVPAGQSSLVPRHAPLSQPGPGPLSLLTPTNFDIAAAPSPTTRSQILPPASSSNSFFSSAPSSTNNSQLSAEVRQSLNRSAPAAPGGKPSLQKASDPAVAPQNFVPQFGPAHRGPQESDVDTDNMPDTNTQAVVQTPDQSQVFPNRLSRAQEQSQVWNYIKDKLDNAKITCKSDGEEEALLEILQLPQQNDLDDQPMRAQDKHQRRYNVMIGSILQVVGEKGHCVACRSRTRKFREHRGKTCVGLPPGATGPQYQNLVDFVAGRCSNCIRSAYPPSSCHFAAGEPPADARDEEPGAAAHPSPGDVPAQNQERVDGAGQSPPRHPSHSPAPGAKKRDPSPSPEPKLQDQASPVPEEDGASDRNAETIIGDAIVVGFRASTQLRADEQQGFHDWMTAMFSFSSSSPDLEGQALAALTRLRQLPSDTQADIRRRILQMLPGAMGRPA